MFFQASNTRHVPTILTKLQLPHMSILTRWHDWIHHLNAIRIGVLTLELEHKKYLQCLFKHLTPGVCQLLIFFKGFYLTNFTGNPSSTWKAFSYGLELLKKGLVWRVENGESIRIWQIAGCPEFRMVRFSPKEYRRINWVSELLDDQGRWQNSWSVIPSFWLMPMLSSRLNHEGMVIFFLFRNRGL